jgi:uncharacterized integral membrane protein
MATRAAPSSSPPTPESVGEGRIQSLSMMNDPPRTHERYRPSPKLIIGAVIALVALVFVFQNTDRETVKFLWMDFNAPAWMWLLVIFLAGALVGYMFARRQARRVNRNDY